LVANKLEDVLEPEVLKVRKPSVDTLQLEYRVPMYTNGNPILIGAEIAEVANIPVAEPEVVRTESALTSGVKVPLDAAYE
jgi:hypothetical protein